MLRGQSRKGVRLNSTILRSQGGATTIRVSEARYAGVENLTLTYLRRDGGMPPAGVYRDDPDAETVVNGITIDRNAKNNWVRNCDILNSGNDPIRVDGQHNTLTANYVEGSFNKGGGRGYYRIAGKYNLVRGETVKDVRHYGVLINGAEYNVTVKSFFETDINYHTGDFGNNLFEGNTVKLPPYHGWHIIGTGEPLFAHMPPGVGNLVVNNWTFDTRGGGRSLYSQTGVVYAFEGYYGPVATELRVPSGGRFYVSAYPQIDPQLPFENGTSDILEYLPAILSTSKAKLK